MMLRRALLRMRGASACGCLRSVAHPIRRCEMAEFFAIVARIATRRLWLFEIVVEIMLLLLCRACVSASARTRLVHTRAESARMLHTTAMNERGHRGVDAIVPDSAADLCDAGGRPPERRLIGEL